MYLTCFSIGFPFFFFFASFIFCPMLVGTENDYCYNILYINFPTKGSHFPVAPIRIVLAFFYYLLYFPSFLLCFFAVAFISLLQRVVFYKLVTVVYCWKMYPVYDYYFLQFLHILLIESSDLQQAKYEEVTTILTTVVVVVVWRKKNGKGRINSKESLLLTDSQQYERKKNINIRSLLWNDYWKVLWWWKILQLKGYYG